MRHSPCLYYGHPAEQVDHIQPRAAGGRDAPANLAPACKSCNSAKGARPVEYSLRQHLDVLARVHACQTGEDVLSGLTPGEKPRAKITKDDRINTTLRISPAGLEALKNVAAAKRVRVNDLLLEGAEHVLALRGRKMQLRNEY